MPTRKLSYDRVTWTDIIQPSEEDVQTIGRAHPYIHPLNLEDLRSPIERPKIDFDDSYLFVVLHFPLFDKEQRLTRASEVDMILGRGFVVTIHDGSLRPLTDLFQFASEDETVRAELLRGGASHPFYVIIDRLVDHILPMLRRIDVNIRGVEEAIFTADARSIIRDIAQYRRDIIALRRIVRQQLPVVEALEKTDHPILREDMEEYFGDVVDHLNKARDIIDEDAEIIVGLSETVDMLANHRINEVMRILTVISVIMLPLTLISSIYGMNVDLPFGDSQNAFIIVSILMIAMTVAMLAYFRRRKWL